MRFLFVAIALLGQSVNVSPMKHASVLPIQDDRYVQDLHDKNIDDVITLYTSRAVFIDSEGHTYKGPDELRSFFERKTNAYDMNLHLEMITLKRTPDAAIEHGRYIETLRNRSTGATREIRGTYVFLHERQSDGEWLIAHQRWTLSPLH